MYPIGPGQQTVVHPFPLPFAIGRPGEPPAQRIVTGIWRNDQGRERSGTPRVSESPSFLPALREDEGCGGISVFARVLSNLWSSLDLPGWKDRVLDRVGSTGEGGEEEQGKRGHILGLLSFNAGEDPLIRGDHSGSEAPSFVLRLHLLRYSVVVHATVTSPSWISIGPGYKSHCILSFYMQQYLILLIPICLTYKFLQYSTEVKFSRSSLMLLVPCINSHCSLLLYMQHTHSELIVRSYSHGMVVVICATCSFRISLAYWTRCICNSA